MEYVDLQVNGFAGVDFSAEGLTPENIELVAQRLAGAGTAKFLPTVITSPPDVYRQVLPVLGKACAGNPHVKGIHLEGPFISPQDGAVGVHPKHCVQTPSIDLFKQMQEQSAFQLGQEVLLMVIQTALNLALPIQNQV